MASLGSTGRGWVRAGPGAPPTTHQPQSPRRRAELPGCGARAGVRAATSASAARTAWRFERPAAAAATRRGKRRPGAGSRRRRPATRPGEAPRTAAATVAPPPSGCSAGPAQAARPASAAAACKRPARSRRHGYRRNEGRGVHPAEVGAHRAPRYAEHARQQLDESAHSAPGRLTRFYRDLAELVQGAKDERAQVHRARPAPRPAGSRAGPRPGGRAGRPGPLSSAPGPRGPALGCGQAARSPRRRWHPCAGRPGPARTPRRRPAARRPPAPSRKAAAGTGSCARRLPAQHQHDRSRDVLVDRALLVAAGRVQAGQRNS